MVGKLKMHRTSISVGLIWVVVLILLNISCANKEVPKIKVINLEKVNLNEKAKGNRKIKYTSGIRSILQDRNGNYWFGSHQEGVCLFDGKSFSYFTIEDGLSNNQVRKIQEDERGIIWFGTADGVSSYDGKRIKNHTSKNDLAGIESIREGNWKLTDNDLWFSDGNKSRVYRFDGEELTYLNLPIPENYIFKSYGGTGFSRGKNNNIWIATYAAVFGYDGTSFKIIDEKKLDYPETGLHVRSILEDTKGRLWIGNNGIGVLLKEGDSIFNFSEKHGLIHANSSRSGGPSPAGTLEHVFAIEEDESGNIWFGDRDTGVWKFDGKSMTNYIIEEKIKSPMIWDIYKNKNGVLLFGLAEGGVYIFDEDGFERKF